MIADARTALEDPFKRLVQGLCLHPADLEMIIEDEQIGMARGLVVMLRTHRADFGRVLGKLGANIKALEIVAQAIGRLADVPVEIGPLLDPTVGMVERHRFMPNCGWPEGSKVISDLACKIAQVTFGRCDSSLVSDIDNSHRSKLVLMTAVHPGRKLHCLVIAAAMVRLFDSIGRKYGRIVELAIHDDDGEWQPDTADGRFAKAVDR